MSEHKFNPDYAVPPGETIRELMDERRWDVSDLAYYLALHTSSVEGLLAGTRKLSKRIAHRLGVLFHVPDKFWLDRERGYREQLEHERTASDSRQRRLRNIQSGCKARCQAAGPVPTEGS